MIGDFPKEINNYFKLSPKSDGFVFEAEKAAEDFHITTEEAKALFSEKVSEINADYRAEYGHDLFVIEEV